MKRKAVFLDRDGVLNRAIVRNGKPYPPAGPAELELSHGADVACRRLHEAGFLLIGVTNQPDVARGIADRAMVEDLNRTVATLLGLDEIRVCMHDDADACDCRKPRPGLLTSAAAEYGIDLRESYMVGDRWRDIEAGRRAGCQTIFIDHGYEERRPDAPNYVTDSLLNAAIRILSGQSRQENHNAESYRATQG
jgi:D-glycero-D-manno-heptose 1,7-bisphosphate phosphatase